MYAVDDVVDGVQPTVAEERMVSGLVDRITAVLAAHSVMVGFTRTRCSCGYALSSPYVKTHAAHVAERVAAEFNLTEETQNRPVLAYDDPPAPQENNRVGGPDQVWATHYELVPSSRHVSEWEPRIEHANHMRPWTTAEETPLTARWWIG
jgi:hypothetical protein